MTRPDLVFPKTRETSFSTAGAAVAVFLGLLALAFGFAAGFLVVAAALVVFLGAAGFLAVVALAFYRESVTGVQYDKGKY